jgi:hypothetical protein
VAAKMRELRKYGPRTFRQDVEFMVNVCVCFRMSHFCSPFTNCGSRVGPHNWLTPVVSMVWLERSPMQRRVTGSNLVPSRFQVFFIFLIHTFFIFFVLFVAVGLP